MEKKLSILSIAFVTLFVPITTFAQNENRTDPDHAQYSIIGTISYDKVTGNRYLNNAQGKRIEFEYKSKRIATPTADADLQVRFDSVKTDHNGGRITKLDFWRYDNEVGEWIYDSEVQQGKSELESTMKTNIMLVIDNSKSLGKDSVKAQNAAIEFVNYLYRESNGKDIFRIGVIGFSSIKFTKKLDIKPLNYYTRDEICDFIKNLQTGYGTAFYYSLETALKLLEEDAKKIDKDAYKESRIYAFTDGLDQASIDDTRNLTTPTQYFDYITPLMQGNNRKRIMGKTVKTTNVIVPGNDMTKKQQTLLKQRAKVISDKVSELNDMSQLVSEFKNLAADLVKSNYVLYCYIPEGASGRVGWTFHDPKQEFKPLPLPKKPSQLWIGLGLEGGYLGGGESDSNDGNTDGSGYGVARVDAAWPISDKIALGGTCGFGLGFKFGPLAKFSFNNGSAFLLGLGYLTSTNGAFYVNGGWKFESPWYVNVGLNLGEGIGFGIGVGYTIGGK